MTEAPARGALRHAAAVIAGGGIVAYPAEACYGLGCDPRNQAALRRLLRIKHRPAAQGLILIAATWRQLLPWLAPLPEAMRERVRATWPGPETWLLPAAPGVSMLLRGDHDTLAVRVTAHREAGALCRTARRALVSTSANRHARPPLRSAEQVRRELGGLVDYVLPGTTSGLARPTRIRDAASGAVVRAAS